MKKYHLYIKAALILVFSINLISCEDYLEEEPKDLLVETNYFQTEADAVSAITGVYLKFDRQGGYLYGRWAWRALEVTSQQVLDNDGKSRYDEHSYNSSDSYIGQLWEGFYSVISRANFVMEKVSEMSISNRDEIIGEAKFLRAYAYFMLVNLFGDVPLRTEAVKSGEVEVVQIPATSAEEIYTSVIIPDFQEAVENLPPWRDDKINKFRVTSVAAQAMLARVHLYREDWQMAMQAAQKAINDGETAGYGLFENYMQVWGASYSGGKEHLFWVNYADGANGDLLPRYLSPSNNHIIKVRGWGDNRYVEPNFYDNWPDDFRKLSAAPTGSYNENGVFEPFKSGYAHGAKHWDPEISSGWGRSNKILLRFGELYLIYAEAANEANGGPTPEAIEALNTIRQRARNFYELNYLGEGALVEENREVPGLEDVDPANPPTQAEFRDMVYNEKDWELFYEYHSRMENVRRHRRAMKGEIDSKYLLENVLADYGTQVDNQIHGLFPIPLRELRLNPKLQQNLGY